MQMDDASIDEGSSSVESTPSREDNKPVKTRKSEGHDHRQSQVDALLRQQKNNLRSLRSENATLRKQLYHGNAIHNHGQMVDSLELFELKKLKLELMEKISEANVEATKAMEELADTEMQLEIEKSKPLGESAPTRVSKSEKRANVIENRVVACRRKSSRVIAQNKVIRAEIDALRKELLTCRAQMKLAEESDTIEKVYWKEYQKQYDDEMSERNQILNEIKRLQTDQINEHKTFSLECTRLDEQMRQIGLEAEPNADKKLKKKGLRRLALRDVKKVAKGAVQMERTGAIEEFESWVQEIKSRTGYDDIESFIDHFLTTEDSNYRRYIDLNGIIMEQIKTEQEIKQLKEEEIAMQKSMESRVMSASTEAAFESKLNSATFTAEDRARQAERSERALRQLETSVGRMYNLVYGSSGERNLRSGGLGHETRLLVQLGSIEKWVEAAAVFRKRRLASAGSVATTSAGNHKFEQNGSAQGRNRAVSVIPGRHTHTNTGTASPKRDGPSPRHDSIYAPPQTATSQSSAAKVTFGPKPVLVVSRENTARVRVAPKVIKEKKKVSSGAPRAKLAQPPNGPTSETRQPSAGDETPASFSKNAADIFTLRPPSVTISESSSSDDEFAAAQKPPLSLDPVLSSEEMRNNIGNHLPSLLQPSDSLLSFKPEPTKVHHHKKKIKVYKGLTAIFSSRAKIVEEQLARSSRYHRRLRSSIAVDSEENGNGTVGSGGTTGGNLVGVDYFEWWKDGGDGDSSAAMTATGGGGSTARKNAVWDSAVGLAEDGEPSGKAKDVFTPLKTRLLRGGSNVSFSSLSPRRQMLFTTSSKHEMQRLGQQGDSPRARQNTDEMSPRTRDRSRKLWGSPKRGNIIHAPPPSSLPSTEISSPKSVSAAVIAKRAKMLMPSPPVASSQTGASTPQHQQGPPQIKNEWDGLLTLKSSVSAEPISPSYRRTFGAGGSLPSSREGPFSSRFLK